MKITKNLSAVAALCIGLSSCASFSYEAECDPTVEADSSYTQRSHRSREYIEPKENYQRRVETVHLMVGEMSLRDEDYWGPLDEPWSFGVDYASASTESGVGPEFGFHLWGDSTGSSSTDEDLSGVEISAGMRNTWGLDRNGPRPYIGVGAALIAASLEGPAYSEDESSFGLYGHAGVTMPLGPGMGIGIDYRVLRGSESEFPGGPDSDFDYNRLSLVLGWSF